MKGSSNVGPREKAKSEKGQKDQRSVQSKKSKKKERDLLKLRKELKKETEARKQAEEKLIHERRVIKTLIDIIPDTIYTKDTAKRKLMSNKADLEIIGKPESEVIGKTDY